MQFTKFAAAAVLLAGAGGAAFTGTATADPGQSNCPAPRLPVTVSDRISLPVGCDVNGLIIATPSGLSAEVPAVGEEVRAHVLNAFTGSETLTLTRSPAGGVTAQRRQSEGVEPAFSNLVPDPGYDVCSDSTYLRSASADGEQFRMTAQEEWFYNPANRPTNMSLADSETALVNGAQNLVLGRNDCGLSAVPASSNAYSGQTTRLGNISGDLLRCTTPDGVTVVTWGLVSGNGNLAVACARSQSGSLTDGDIRFNTRYNWDYTLTDGCYNGSEPTFRSFDITSVATHEWGHVAGLGHVSETGHGPMTMSEQTAECDVSARTLGKGDHAGMIAIYGSR